MSQIPRPADWPAANPRARLAGDTVTVTAIVVGMIVAVVVFYVAAPAFFLLFAAMLLAAIFDGVASWLTRLGLPRTLALVLIFLLTLALLVAPVVWGGAALVQQFNELSQGLQAQADRLADQVRELGVPMGKEGEEGSDLQSMLPSSGGVLSSASRAVFGFLGAVGNVFVVLFMAIFISFQPGLYRRGIVSLFPKARRARMAEVLDASARALVLWVVGTGISMATIFVVTWIGLASIGMPYAFLLAVQAGLLAFIPTLGPFLAGIPIILVGLGEGGEMALWGLGVYVLIQGIESNATQPIAQRMTTSLPPALTLGAQLVFGVLFGLLGVMLVVPLLAVVFVFVEKLYVEDALGGPWREADGDS